MSRVIETNSYYRIVIRAHDKTPWVQMFGVTSDLAEVSKRLDLLKEKHPNYDVRLHTKTVYTTETEWSEM